MGAKGSRQRTSSQRGGQFRRKKRGNVGQIRPLSVPAINYSSEMSEWYLEPKKCAPQRPLADNPPQAYRGNQLLSRPQAVQQSNQLLEEIGEPPKRGIKQRPESVAAYLMHDSSSSLEVAQQWMPQELDIELLQQCVALMKEAVAEAFKYHDDSMQHFLHNGRGSYTERDITIYHERLLDTTKKAFVASLDSLSNLDHPQIPVAINNAMMQLETKIKSQLDLYYRKYEIFTETMAKDMKMFTIQAEAVYHEHMNVFSHIGKTIAQLEDLHGVGIDKAVATLESLFKERGYDFAGNKWELDFLLRENWELILEEWEDEVKAAKNDHYALSALLQSA